MAEIRFLKGVFLKGRVQANLIISSCWAAPLFHLLTPNSNIRIILIIGVLVSILLH